MVGNPMTGFLAVKNFERFQHYKNRHPPWIKLHCALLDDYEFGRLQDASKMHLIGIWVLASKSENRIPDDPEWIGRRIGASDPVNIEVLVNAGFLMRLQRASDVLADDKQSALLVEESRGETEGETESTLPGARAAFGEVEKGLSTDEQRTALRALTRASRNPPAFVLELKAILTGMRRLSPYHPTPAQVGEALWDMHVNGKPPEVRVLHAYCVRAARPAKPVPTDGDSVDEYEALARKTEAESRRAS